MKGNSMKRVARVLGIVLFVIAMTFVIFGCEGFSRVGGVIMPNSQIPPNTSPSDVVSVPLDVVLEESIKSNESWIKLLPQGGVATALAYIGIAGYRKIKPQLTALREVVKGIEETSGGTSEVKASLSIATSNKTKKIVAELIAKDTVVTKAS